MKAALRVAIALALLALVGPLPAAGAAALPSTCDASLLPTATYASVEIYVERAGCVQIGPYLALRHAWLPCERAVVGADPSVGDSCSGGWAGCARVETAPRLNASADPSCATGGPAPWLPVVSPPQGCARAHVGKQDDVSVFSPILLQGSTLPAASTDPSGPQIDAQVSNVEDRTCNDDPLQCPPGDASCYLSASETSAYEGTPHHIGGQVGNGGVCVIYGQDESGRPYATVDPQHSCTGGPADQWSEWLP